MAKVNQQQQHQQHHQQQPQQQQQKQKQPETLSQQPINTDELAREKVQEVENLLDLTDSLKVESLNSWLSILKQIITAADLHRTNDKDDNSENVERKGEVDESIYADYADDNEQFNAADLTEQFATNSVKWTIRVRAFKVVHRIVQMFFDPNHRTASFRSSILRHLPDLVRLSFIAATSPYDDLKIQGFEMFRFVIVRFASFEEREFPGHSILDQYRTQVLSALKPAFNLDAPPYITAIASQVCSLWLCKGLEKDHINLKRSYQLMMTTIDKLEHQSINQNSKLYTESELEQERLDILGSWAQLYIKSRDHDESIPFNELNKSSSNILKFDTKLLYELIKPHVSSLIDKWWEALRDYALLIMPAPRMPGVSHDNEHVYTRDVALGLFDPVWPKLVLASTIWLCHDESAKSDTTQLGHDDDSSECLSGKNNNESDQNCDNKCDQKKCNTRRVKYLRFICGMLMRELIKCHSDKELQRETLPESTIHAIRSLFILVSDNEFKKAFTDDMTVLQEFYSILYAILINQVNVKGYQFNLLKKLLESIFNLVLNKIGGKPDSLRYALDYLLVSISNNINKISEALNNDNLLVLDTSKLRLSIELTNLVLIIKISPVHLSDNTDIQQALFKTFKSMITFEGDSSINLICLDHSRDLLTLKPLHLVSKVIDNLFDSKLIVVSKLIERAEDNKLSANDKTNNTIAILEAYLKSLKLDVSYSEKSKRKDLVASYIKTLLPAISNLCNQDGVINQGGRKETIDLGTRYLQDFKTTYKLEFEESLDPKSKLVYESLVAPKEKPRTASPVKQTPTKTGTTSTIGRKPATKIVLKADFSHFYAKKT